MDMVKVGDYEVSALSVGEGLDLLALITEDPAAFQKQLVLRSVRKDGASIVGVPFAKIIPVLPELMKTAMRLNGFDSTPPEV